MGDYYSGPRTYDMLSDSEKVKAILAAVQKPVSKQFALELSGINPNNVSQIESIFFGSEVVKSGSEQEPRFVLSATAKDSLGEIDWKSVHKRIADDLLQSLYPEK